MEWQLRNPLDTWMYGCTKVGTDGLNFHTDGLKGWLTRIISDFGTSQRIWIRETRYSEFSIQRSHYADILTSWFCLLDGRGVRHFRPSPRSKKESSLYKVRWSWAVGGSHFKSGSNCVCLHCATVRLKGVNMRHWTTNPPPNQPTLTRYTTYPHVFMAPSNDSSRFGCAFYASVT